MAGFAEDPPGKRVGSLSQPMQIAVMLVIRRSSILG
jgi:hypothetical protein